MNCLNCDNCYWKDIAFDEMNPDYVIICNVDNAYIGYPDEAEKEECRFTKEEIEEFEKRRYKR